MIESWVKAHKLAAPTPPAGFVPRTGLAAETPLVLLVAGAGYGKTLGLLALTQRVTAAGGLAAWYSLDDEDAEPETFFPRLVAAIAVAVPGFGTEVEARLSAGEADAKILWAATFRALAAYGLPPFALALDDAHHLGQAVLQGLSASLDRLPPGVQVLLSSRRKLPLATARLAARGLVTVLDAGALRFTPAEEAAFFPGGTVPAAAARLEGWPLGLAMVASGGHTAGFGAGDDLVAAYVAEELFQAQPPARQAFMLRAALLDEPEPAALAAAGVADAALHLDALVAEQLVFGLAGGARRFPAYLLDFLRAEAETALPAAERAELHRAVARHHLATGDVGRAVPRLLAAGAGFEALAAIRQAGPPLMAAGRHPVVARWLRALPALAAASPAATLWAGLVHAARGEQAEALACYEAALAGFEAADDEAGILTATIRLASTALVMGDTARYAQLWPRAQARLQAGGPADVADLYLIRALAAERRGDMALMRECNEAVVALPVGGRAGEEVEAATCRAIALFNLHTWHLHHGSLADARTAIEEAIGVSEAWNFGAYALLAGFLRAHLDGLVGRLDAAGAFLRALPPGWADGLDWHDRACAYVVLGAYHLATGDAEAAEEALRRGHRLFVRAAFPEGEKMARERLVMAALLRKAPARALELAGDECGNSVYDAALALAAARATHLAGRPADAVLRLDALAPTLQALDARLLTARAALYRAAALRAAGDANAAQALADAEAYLDAGDFGFLRTQDQVLWESLAAPAPASGLEIKLFGAFEARRDGVLLDQWPRKKARLLLAGLALYPRGLDAATIADLWGEAAATRDLQVTVRVNIVALRRVLEPQLGKGEASRYVLFENDRYLLAPAVVASLDVRDFDVAIRAADTRARTAPAEAETLYTAALMLYRDTLLDDPAFQGTFEAERERYRRLALRALGFLADRQPAEAEAWLMRAVALAPAEEDGYLRLMRHQASQGRPERARQTYWDGRKALVAHGLAPGPELDAAYAGL